MKKISFFLFFLSFLPLSFAQQSWFLLSTNSEYNLANGMAFPSVDTGYYSGSYGYKLPSFIRATIDGGKTWRDIGSIYVDYPHHPFFVNSQIGFFLDGDKAIISTLDAGLSWRRYSFSHDFANQGLLSISFPKPSIGFVCGRENVTDFGLLILSSY